MEALAVQASWYLGIALSHEVHLCSAYIAVSVVWGLDPQLWRLLIRPSIECITQECHPQTLNIPWPWMPFEVCPSRPSLHWHVSVRPTADKVTHCSDKLETLRWVERSLGYFGLC